MKLQDGMVLIKDVEEADCEEKCKASCNCTAYSFANLPMLDSKTRCLVWYGDMIDLVQNLTYEKELKVRAAASNITGSFKKSNNSVVIIIPVFIGLILLLTTMGYLTRLKQKRTGITKRTDIINTLDYSEKGKTDVLHVNFSLIVAATGNFSPSNKLGQGGFGPVFKGIMQNGEEVAVKRLSRSSRQGLEEFKNEVELIAKLQHNNLVKMLGWCSEKDEKILIYEYLQNGSLDKYLFDSDKSTSLDWKRRWCIIEGIAQGLLYLHRYSRLRVNHRDLKTSNILLDDKMNPKISDFGLARIFDGNQVEANTEKIAGTYGYMSPEYALQGIYSEKSDVFSYGVIMLETVTGKKNTGSYLYEDSLNLLGYVWQFWVEESCPEVADQSLGDSFSLPQLLRCIQIALLCVQERAAERPTISCVVHMLGNENVVLPSPGEPAFTIGNKVATAAGSTSSYFRGTIAQLTDTSREAR